MSAVLGNRPKTVTSGVTPLEGLPGRTACGELDSSMILLLAQEMKCNAERLNAILTQESGLLGLTGQTMTLQELFASEEESVRWPRKSSITGF
jgi:acetate kinase